MRRLMTIVLAASLLVALSTMPLALGSTVVICHAPPDNPANGQTITVGAQAAQTHLSTHPWDHSGPCEAAPTNVSLMVFVSLVALFSVFLLYRRRTGRPA